MVAERWIAVTANCVQTAGEHLVEPSIKQKDEMTVDSGVLEEEERKMGCHEKARHFHEGWEP